MMRSPLELVEALGLSSAVEIEDLANRQQAFACVHMGMRDFPIGTLLNLLQDEGLLMPPRTGHLGNWEDIALGRAGAMDFNKAICARSYGYPLIYCFTQTEAEGTSRGDWVYMPGSLLERGRRQVLPLFTWDGTSYVRRRRDHAYFCPFVLTEVDGELLPLIELHWQRMQTIPHFRFGLEAEVIVDHMAEVQSMLALLLEEGSRSENPTRAFRELISHAVAKDGTVSRCEIRREGKGYWMEGCHFKTTEALVDHVLVPFQAVTQPSTFFAEIAVLPPLLPIMSNLLVGIFSAIFTTHYPSVKDARSRVTRPFNSHLHWGARDMAGYPPRRKGYFIERATTRSLRGICSSLIRNFLNIDPVCVVLLPAAVFMLCPTSAHPRDAELLTKLFHRVTETTAGSKIHQSNQMLQTVEEVTQAWLALHAEILSSYFLNRFCARSGVLHEGELPEESEPVEPEGFRHLSLQQACMIVGALVKAMPSRGPT